MKLSKPMYEPDSYELNLRLGWLHYQKGEMDQSMVFYRRAVNLKPYAIEPKLGLAYPYSAMAKWDDVIELYERILETDPQNSLVNYRLGLIYYNRGQYERADSYIEKTVNLYPFDYDSLLLFAWNKLMMQRTREAKVLFEKVLLANPGDESALKRAEPYSIDKKMPARDKPRRHLHLIVFATHYLLTYEEYIQTSFSCSLM